MKKKNQKLLVAGVIAGGLALRQFARRKAVSFSDKIVLITGGSRGLGLVLARYFGKEGAKLALVARDSGELDTAVDELQCSGVSVLPIVGDVTLRLDAIGAVERTVKHFGRVDVLVNNAGVIQAGPLEN